MLRNSDLNTAQGTGKTHTQKNQMVRHEHFDQSIGCCECVQMGNGMLGMLEHKAAMSSWDLAPWTTAIFVKAKDPGAIMLPAILVRFLSQQM